MWTAVGGPIRPLARMLRAVPTDQPRWTWGAATSASRDAAASSVSRRHSAADPAPAGRSARRRGRRPPGGRRPSTEPGEDVRGEAPHRPEDALPVAGRLEAADEVGEADLVVHVLDPLQHLVGGPDGVAVEEAL